MEDKYSRIFDDTSDEKEEQKDLEEEKVHSPEQPKVAPFTHESLRLHQAKLKEAMRGNFVTESQCKHKEDSSDSFTSISTDIQNAIHYDLLENEIYHTCNYSRDSGSTS